MNLELVVLVPDKNIEQAIRGLLARPERIAMRPLSQDAVEFVVTPGRDPGVFKHARGLLKPYLQDNGRALVILDRAWDGAPTSNPSELAAGIEAQLTQWGDRARCLCIDPEIEAWIWSDSPHVATQLGWTSLQELRVWLESLSLWPDESEKPPDPKTAFLAATKEKRVTPSSAIFRQLAMQVSFKRCRDRSFNQLLCILRAWFPADQASP